MRGDLDRLLLRDFPLAFLSATFRSFLRGDRDRDLLLRLWPFLLDRDPDRDLERELERLLRLLLRLWIRGECEVWEVCAGESGGKINK